MGHKWAPWLHNPCCLVPTLLERGKEIEVAQKGARGHNPCRLGVPTASERRAESEVAHRWARRLHNPRHWGSPHSFEVAHKCARWLHNAYRMGVPTLSKRGAESEVADKGARWL